MALDNNDPFYRVNRMHTYPPVKPITVDLNAIEAKMDQAIIDILTDASNLNSHDSMFQFIDNFDHTFYTWFKEQCKKENKNEKEMLNSIFKYLMKNYGKTGNSAIDKLVEEINQKKH